MSTGTQNLANRVGRHHVQGFAGTIRGMVSRPTLTLVVPAFNEAPRIASSLAKLLDYAASCGMSCEIILVIERSTDGTAAIARRILAGTDVVVIETGVNRGKGYAVKTGMLRATGELVFYMDLDLSTPLAEITRFVERAEAVPAVSIWIGNRRHAQAEIVRRQPLVRRATGKIFSTLVRGLGLSGLSDTQCGFKLFRRHAVAPVFERQSIDGFSFDVEILLIARRLGFEIRDLPVTWHDADGTKLRVVQDSVKMFVDLLVIRRRLRSVRDDRGSA